MKKLLLGRVDLVIIDKTQGQYLINNQFDKKDHNKLSWMEPPIQTNKQYLVICKDAPEASKKIEDFNRGLQLIKESGEVSQILKQHGMN